MTAKQYLRQLSKLELNIKILTDELEERRTRLTSTAAPALGDKVQSSPRGDAFAAAVAALADKDRKRTEMIYVYEQMRDRIVEQILGLDNVTQSQVLYERYVRRQSLRVIADEMVYSYDRICHIHGEALVAFSKRFLDDSRQ